ncbi:hypothetical protein MASR2M17_08990 [Aminivibrio sp.]
MPLSTSSLEEDQGPEDFEFAKKAGDLLRRRNRELPRAQRYTVKVDVHLKDGTVFNLKETYPKGHPKNPFTREELIWKFKSLAGKVFKDEARLDKIIDTILNLEKLENFNELTELLSAKN